MGGRRWLAAGACAAVIAGAANEARAQCTGSSSFATCGSVLITATDLGAGMARIVLAVTGGALGVEAYQGTAFAELALVGLNNFSFVNGSVAPRDAASWELGSNGNAPNDSRWRWAWSFDLDGGGRVNDDAGPRDDGLHPVCPHCAGDAGQGAAGAAIAVNQTAVSPEPATIVLLGSALAGLGARAFARRRRR
jgi:hypothetical protein